MQKMQLEYARQFPRKSFNKGETILYEGQPLDTIFAVESGFIKVTSLSESGHERILWIAGPGSMVPAEQLFSDQGSLQFFYTALSDCMTYKVDKKKFIQHVKATPILMSEIATRMSAHYDDLLIRIDSTAHMSVRNKLIYTLCYFARRFSSDDIVDIYKLGLKLTHQDISEMIGSTRETTSIEFRKLMTEGGVIYNRTQCVINVPRLEEIQNK